MGTVSRELNARLTLDSAGYKRGIAESQAVTNAMKGGLVSLGTAVGGAALGFVGLTGGVAGAVTALRIGLAGIGDMEASMVRLRLATGGNADEFERLKRIVETAPRGGIFDDNDVARALSMAKVIGLTNTEINQLLPSLRGMAAVMGQDLTESVNAVALALETGMVRSLRQYGITQADVEKNARKFYGAEIKDLDETAKRFSILQSVLDKSSLFAQGEDAVLQTLPGAIRAVKTEVHELLEEFAKPAADRMAEVLGKLGDVMRQRSAEGALRDVRELLRQAEGMPGFAAEEARRRAKAIAATLPYEQQIRLPGDISGLGQFALGTPIDVPGARSIPGGVAGNTEAVKRAAAIRARLLGNLEPDRSLVGADFEDADHEFSASEKFRRKQREKRLEEIRDAAEAERDLTAQMTAERLQLEEQMEQDSWQRRIGIAGAFSSSMYNVMASASSAYFAQDERRRKSWLSFAVGAMKQEVAGHIFGLGMKAAQEAAFHAIRGFARLADPFTAPFAAREFAAAAKYGAFAAAAGVAGGALQAAGQRDFSTAEDISDRGVAGGGRRDSGVAYGANRISGIATRPIEHLTLNFGMSVNAQNIFWGVNEQAAQDFTRQFVAAELEKLLKGGGISVN